jgi:hypothetical protein
VSTKKTSYLTAVRSFDHTPLAQHPAYSRLRRALNDLANESSEDKAMGLDAFLEAVRDMALTTPYGDMCQECSKQCWREHHRPLEELCPAGCDTAAYWPHEVERDRDWVHGTYQCTNGHAWTCGYAVDVMKYL